MQYIQTQQQRTLSNVIRNKVLDLIEETTLSSLIRNTVLFTCSLTAMLIFSFPDQTASIAWTAWENSRTLIITGIGSFFFFMNLGSILERIGSISIDWEGTEKSSEATIEGIPTFELLDHLFIEGTFKRAEIESKFGIPRNRFQNLAEQLESIGVLVRGQNNSRVVDESYSRQDLARMISNCSTHDQINPILQDNGNGQFGFGGIGKQLKQRVVEMLTDTPSEDQFVDFNNMAQTPLE